MSDESTWAGVDAFIAETLVEHDEALQNALDAADAGGLRQIQVSAPQGKFLQLLVRMLGAERILEFGTLGGYSTILMARAMPAGGRLTTLEVEPGNAEVAEASIEFAGLSDIVDVRVGPALETLPLLEEEGAGPYDLVFIDADKVNTPNYFAWALERTHPGGLIVADNVVRDGSLGDSADPDPATKAQRQLHETLAQEPRVEATTIQTVGNKGYDGFLIARVV